MRRGNIPMRKDICEKNYHVCVRECVTECAYVMCVITLTFHCHELVLIVVTAANCTVCLICKNKRVFRTPLESFRQLFICVYIAK